MFFKTEDDQSPTVVADPGAGGTIGARANGLNQVIRVTGASTARTLAAPTDIRQKILISCIAGAVTITVASSGVVNIANDVSIALASEGCAKLTAVSDGTAEGIRWGYEASGDGVTLA